ncbi:MAG: sulfite oxidase [Bryobacterales bacterium]|nr:sulfite oxidase [Bryobacterales bacterium]
MRLSRRHLLVLSAFATSLRAGEPVKRGMIVRSARPEDLEMPLDGFRDWITPLERFFVRSHVYTPAVDAAQWKLEVGGEVRNRLSLTLPELQRLPKVELPGVLECAGNGRGLFQPTVPGIQWEYGAVGNAVWAGVRLRDVLENAGLRASARDILFDGADLPIGKMPDFRRSIPVRKALHPDTLLAYQMNGRPLSRSHGFPLRAVVPGWAGDCWVKWVTSIQVLDREYEGFFMRTAYRIPTYAAQPGQAVDPARTAPVTELRVKSVIASPQDGARLAVGKPHAVSGAAWSGESPVDRVEVSADGGRSWFGAELDRSAGTHRAPGRYGWRLWSTHWTPPAPGPHLLMARAMSVSGAAQPLEPAWNPSGYLGNTVHRVRVEAGRAGTPAGPPARPVPAFPVEARTACLGCHGEDIIAGQRLTRAQWERELDKMIGWGAPVTPADRSALVEFLFRHFGPASHR